MAYMQPVMALGEDAGGEIEPHEFAEEDVRQMQIVMHDEAARQQEVARPRIEAAIG